MDNSPKKKVPVILGKQNIGLEEKILVILGKQKNRESSWR